MHVQLQRDSHSFSLTDLVLVAGLYLIEPAALVTAQVAGAGLALVLHRRQFGLKLAFNLAQYALAGCLATTVFTVLSRDDRPVGCLELGRRAGRRRRLARHRAALCIFAVMQLSEGLPGPAASCPACSACRCRSPSAWPRSACSRPTSPSQNPASLVLLALPSVLLIAAYRAYARAREQQNNLRLLHEITSLLYNSDDAPTALTDFLTAVRGAFRADVAELVLFGEDDAAPDAEPQPGRREAGRAAAAGAPGGRRPARRLGRARRGVPTTRTGAPGGAELERYIARHGAQGRHGVGAEPPRAGCRVCSWSPAGSATSARSPRSDLALLETFARHVATSLDRGRLETDLRRVIELQEELRHAAMHDPLTELPNRTLFLDRTENGLNLAGRNGQWPAVLYIDLDGFKPVNDTYGHQAGDLLLKVFAQRLHEAVRTADTAARLGGDEFAVLLHGPIDEPGVRAGARPHPGPAGPARSSSAAGGRAKVGASIGVSFGGPRHRHRHAHPPRRPGDVHGQAQRPRDDGLLRRPRSRRSRPSRPSSRFLAPEAPSLTAESFG